LQGAHYPLDDKVLTMDEEGTTGSHQYFVKLVPTLYSTLSKPYEPVSTYQFSVTEHTRKIQIKSVNAEAAQGVLPGLTINYEPSPLRARIEEKRRSLGHFLTRVCAIIGGIFVVAGLIDSLLFRLQEDWVKKGRKGGAGVLGLD
jgi:endoplasmic reticulum-Golgi intermediate compartment protein 3